MSLAKNIGGQKSALRHPVPAQMFHDDLSHNLYTLACENDMFSIYVAQLTRECLEYKLGYNHVRFTVFHPEDRDPSITVSLLGKENSCKTILDVIYMVPASEDSLFRLFDAELDRYDLHVWRGYN